MKKVLLPLAVFVSALALALYNIAGFPKMVGDEGIYTSQAYWLSHVGSLGPYTYWYDHFPLGWAQIGVWQTLVGTTTFFGNSVLSTRVLMGLILAGSTTLLYLLTKKLAGSKLSGFVASAVFIGSTLTLTFGRMVLLDNLAIFWFLLSLYLLIEHPTKLRNISFSAFALTLGILTKESLLFFLPPYVFLVSHLNKHNVHKRYSLTINYLTIIFFLGFFPLLALLKGELLPHPNQVSLLGTILFQASRGSGELFWNTGSHLREMIDVWIKIDPILLILGGFSSILLILAKVPRVIKTFASFALFYFIFLARGGQIYDFYIIPLLSLFACNIALLLKHIVEKSKLHFVPYLFLISTTIYWVSTSLYPLTTNATKPQLDAIDELQTISDGTIIAPDYAFLDTYLRSKDQKIEWYRKVESDPTIQRTITSPTYMLTDQQFERELLGGKLPYLSQLHQDSLKFKSFGSQISPGEIVKPYTKESLTLHFPTKKQESSTITTLLSLNTESLTQLATNPPFGIMISRDNFQNSQDLESKLNLIKTILPTTLIFTTQDGEGNNAIPWIPTVNRNFYKSTDEAKSATVKKSLALKELGFDGAIIASSSNSDGYLESIVEASDSVFTTLIRYNGLDTPSVATNLYLETNDDDASVDQLKYRGKLIRAN